MAMEENMAATAALDTASTPPPTNNSDSKQHPWSTALRLLRYILNRAVVLGITAVIAIWVAVIAANFGGYVDEIVRSRIVMAVGLGMRADPDQTPEEREAGFRAAIAAAEEAAGLNEPFLLRSLRWTADGLTLNLGRTTVQTINPYPPGGDRRDLKQVIWESIPPTLLLLGIANILIFFTSLFLSLYLSQHYNSWPDRLMISLSPTSVAPAWFYGLFLIAIFAGIFRLFPFGGIRPELPPETVWEQAVSLANHLVLPAAAIFLGTFFQSVYMWRTFFLIYSGEDYVEMARAKGLPDNVISRRYLLRPTLPPIMTSFALMLIGIWSGSVVLETVFNWPGLGRLFFRAILATDIVTIVGLLVVYAYFLVATIFVLDIAYALVDPRVRLGGRNKQQGKNVTGRRPYNPRAWRAWWGQIGQRVRHIKPAWPPSFSWLKPGLSWRQVVADLVGFLGALGRNGRSLQGFFRELIRYPSAVVGLIILGLLVGMMVYGITAVPYDEAVYHWRGATDRRHLPQNARPAWFNYFSTTKRPESIFRSTLAGDGEKQIQPQGDFRELVLTLPVDYPYDDFPQEVFVTFFAPNTERRSHVSLSWLIPDGREVRLVEMSPRNAEMYWPDQDTRLIRRLGGTSPRIGLFAALEQENPTAVRGTYQLQINAILFDEDADLDATLTLHGQVYGLAGTDSWRRDLSVALLWGAPVALAFGLAAALLTTVGTMLIAAVGVWYGGVVDEFIQRLTDVNLVIPAFPILAAITLFYSLSIIYILLLAVLFGILSSTIKTYRAIFLQVKELPFVEAAQAYGAGNLRIIFYYLVPRIVPVLIPQLVFLVPSYVFLEAGLAFLGVSDPILPTWGKIIHDAHVNSALLNGHYHWVLQPAALLFLTGLAFALLGFALDRIFNPRLQDV
jgi:peptide/nickel transport system permease protein